MPINSAMCSIDKTVSLVNAINIFISEGVDELLVWDEEDSKWAWMLTVADIIRFINHAIKCVSNGIPISKRPLTKPLSTSRSVERKRFPSQTSNPPS